MSCIRLALDYSPLPEHLRTAVQEYVEHHVPPGDFLTAVICNDLKGALGSADETSRAALFEIVQWFYTKTPAECWGSRDHMGYWLARGAVPS